MLSTSPHVWLWNRPLSERMKGFCHDGVQRILKNRQWKGRVTIYCLSQPKVTRTGQPAVMILHQLVLYTHLQHCHKKTTTHEAELDNWNCILVSDISLNYQRKTKRNKTKTSLRLFSKTTTAAKKGTIPPLHSILCSKTNSVNKKLCPKYVKILHYYMDCVCTDIQTL